MAINKTTQYTTNPDSIPVNTSTGTQTLAGALDGRVVHVASIADMTNLPADGLTDEQLFEVKGYNAGSSVGGGVFYWDATNTTAENGVTVFGTYTEGRFIRIIPDGWDGIPPEMAGGVPGQDCTSAIDSILALGKACYLKDGNKYIYAGVNSSVSGWGFVGKGTLEGEGQDAFVLTSGSGRLNGVTLSKFGTFSFTDTDGLGKIIDYIDIEDATFDDVYMAVAIEGTGGFKKFKCINSEAYKFSRLFRLDVADFETVVLSFNKCIGDPAWNYGDAYNDYWPTRYGGQKHVLWVGLESSGTKTGNVIATNNEITKIINNDGRADGILVEKCNTFKAHGNHFEILLPYKDTYDSQGYLDYEDGNSSALYSSSSNKTIYSNNTAVDAATSTFTCTSATVMMKAYGNEADVTSSGGWCDRGIFMRAPSLSVRNNRLDGYPRPILYINVDALTYRNSAIDHNYIDNTKASTAIEVNGLRRAVSIRGNKIDGVDNSHPTAKTDYISGVRASGAGSNGQNNIVSHNDVFNLTDSAALGTKKVGVLIHNTVGTSSNSSYQIEGNTTYAEVCVGFHGPHVGHFVHGNGSVTSSSPTIEILTGDTVYLDMGHNLGYSEFLSSQNNIAATDTSRTISISELGNVTFNEELLIAVYMDDTACAVPVWFSAFGTAGTATMNFESLPDTMRVKMKATLSGKTVRFN